MNADLETSKTRSEDAFFLKESGSMAEDLVSVIVVNLDRADLLRECLASLLSQGYPAFETIVVDNGSSDGSVALVEGWGDPRLRLVRLAENRGFAGGCNAGLRVARGEWIALLNNDAVAAPGWLSALVEGARRNPRLGMCASKVLFHGTDVIDKAGHLIYWDGQNRGRGTGESDSHAFGEGSEALFPDGCAALYRRTLLVEVGGFDEDFFAYGDDADLGLRARLLGWKCRYVPEAVAYHRHSATSGRFSERKIYWVERNRFWLAVKSFPTPLLLLNPVFTLYRWLWNVGAFLAARGPAGNFRRAGSFRGLSRAVLSAYVDGLRGLPRMLGKRRSIRRGRRLGDGELYALLWRFRISARTLASRDFGG